MSYDLKFMPQPASGSLVMQPPMTQSASPMLQQTNVPAAKPTEPVKMAPHSVNTTLAP